MGSESVGQDILISGRVDMNRAMDGDVVAGELSRGESGVLMVVVVAGCVWLCAWLGWAGCVNH